MMTKCAYALQNNKLPPIAVDVVSVWDMNVPPRQFLNNQVNN